MPRRWGHAGYSSGDVAGERRGFKRAIDAYNRRDLKALLREFDPKAEWRVLTHVMFGGESTVYRGHEGIRDFVREVDEAFAEAQIEYLGARDLGEGVVGRGRIRIRDRASGAESESPIAWVIDFERCKVIRIIDYAEPAEAPEAAGLSE